MIRVVLFDLDGVIRHFDPSNVAAIEQRHGIDAGDIERIAFASPLIEQVTTGAISRDDWVETIGTRLGNRHAAIEWGRQPWRVDAEMLRLSDELRTAAITTAILTNGTDSIPSEVAEMGLSDHFDRIFNSAEIGYVKPDVRAFQHVTEALDVPAEQVFFTDDSAGKLGGAQKLGMITHHFRGIAGLREALSAAVALHH